jgi:thymidylate synthase ThyX
MTNQITATLIDHMGSDLTTVNAARVSFGKVSDGERIEFDLLHHDPEVIKASVTAYKAEGWVITTDLNSWKIIVKRPTQKDAKLIRYLAEHKHFSPFGHAFASFHVKAPIFVARQLVKHKFLRWNEVSRRYVDDEPEFYTPEVWRSTAENVKQGSSTKPKPHPEFTQGFCINCGNKVSQAIRGQGGGREKKYCGVNCKSTFTNRHRDPYKAAFQNAKARVQREGKRSWGLNHEDMVYPEYCPYLGIRLDYSFGDKGSPQDNSPSFDRIDSMGEYTHDNVQVISNLANSMKNSADKEQQIAFAKKVLLMYEGYIVNDTKTYKGQMDNMVEVYNSLIASGYPAEQARMVLPQSTLTEFYWSGSLDAFANMCILRLKGDTQYETRLVAQQIDKVMAELFPVSWAALVGEQ